MKHSTNNFKLSDLWTCQRSIEDFCAQHAEALLKSVDAMFSEMRSELENAMSPCVLLANDSWLPSNASTTEDCRDSAERIRMLMHINSIQLEVLRRATHHKRDEADALAVKNAKLAAHVDEHRIPSFLPTLPNEIMAHIFSFLYWLEDDKLPMHPDYLADNETTLQKLLADDDTSEAWKSLINHQIPCLLKTSGPGADEILRFFGPNMGPHPKILSIHGLDRDTEGIVERPSTTIVVNLSDGMHAIEVLEIIRQKTWRNVFIAELGQARTPTESIEAIKSLVKSFGEKLKNLDRLELIDNSSNTLANINTASTMISTETSDTEALMARLSHAYLPPHHLPNFRPVLTSISILETAIRTCIESGRALLDIDTLFRALTPYSNTLSNLTISNSTSALEANKPRDRYHISFPRLKHLRLNSFTDVNILDILGAIDCPALSHFTLTMYQWPPLENDPPRKDSPISAKFLHNIFPNLEFISMIFGALELDARFLSDLTGPDENGNWMFPMLNSMKFRSFSSRASLTQMPLLRVLLKVVVNRLRSNDTKSIRYLSIPDFGEVELGDSDCLRLFVPEVHFFSEPNHGSTHQSGW
ncbi:hypothetical protein SCHPADRAFT_902339 [Schizopora paradoxa]|uniref:F-box domain-containing protein n=1 Tax=Schizopora paradoxa TaxID=27342 RepID=A0A0H2RV45_9AGAM|nr:hypothetical protein SCHPADRAFT_902339 [Schizopora paradoxa]